MGVFLAVDERGGAGWGVDKACELWGGAAREGRHTYETPMISKSLVRSGPSASTVV